ncbi:hypothetical protein QYF36_022558 [Acer negundo]|nr:hypothetical protein QYF36_022558 [Acer negundo]
MTSSRMLLLLLLIMNMNQSSHHPMYNNHLIQGKHFWLIIIKDQYPIIIQELVNGHKRALACARAPASSSCTSGLLSTIFYILEKHNLDVVSAHVTSDSYRRMYMIQAHASGASNQFPEALSVEETFKLAVEDAEKEETEEKVKKADDIPFEEPLLYKEFKPYVSLIAFASQTEQDRALDCKLCGMDGHEIWNCPLKEEFLIVSKRQDRAISQGIQAFQQSTKAYIQQTEQEEAITIISNDEEVEK